MEAPEWNGLLYAPFNATWQNGQKILDISLEQNAIVIEARLEDTPPPNQESRLNLSDCTVTFALRPVSGMRVLINKQPCVVTDPASNLVAYNLSETDRQMLAAGRTYLACFMVTFPDGRVKRFGDARLTVS